MYKIKYLFFCVIFIYFFVYYAEQKYIIIIIFSTQFLCEWLFMLKYNFFFI